MSLNQIDMKLWKVCILILCAAFTGGCDSPPERQGVPVFAGISLTEACNVDHLIAGLSVYEQFGLKGWVLEFPMLMHPVEEASDFRYYEKHTLDTIIHILKTKSYPYTLAFNLENPKSYTTGSINLTNYLLDISAVLLRTQSYPPEQLIFMGEFLNTDLMEDKLPVFIKNIKSELDGFKGEIIYALFPYQFEKMDDWETPDLIGIRYHEATDEDLRNYYYQLNRKLGSQLKKHKKDLFISQSNLMGDNKLDMFKNQLRFWDQALKVNGIVLNSLSCRVSLEDEDSFFALGEDDAFKDYLSTYIHD